MTTTAEVRRVVQRWAAAFDPALVTAADAALMVDVAAEVEHLAAYVKIQAAERVASTSAWHGSGKKSPQDWLADRTGSSTNEAAEMLKTARKLKRLPKTRRAMAKGKLSAAQAAAVADAAEADPDAEEALLETADKATLKNLKDEAARVKAAATADDGQREARIHARRSVRTYIDRDGAFNLHLRSTAAAGIRLMARMRAQQEGNFRQNRTDGTHESFDARAHDAFLASIGFDPHGRPHPTQFPPPAASPTGPKLKPKAEPVEDPPARPMPPPPVGGNNIKVIVRIDHTALTRGHSIAGETVEVAGLGPISVATARLLMHDAFLTAVITNGKDVCTVAHLGRSPTAYQRTALEARHIACTNLGCNTTIGIQIDHRDPWADTHHTPTGGLDPLCPHCHRLKTHHGHRLEPGTGPRQLLTPDQLSGHASPSSPPDHPAGPQQAPETGEQGSLL